MAYGVRALRRVQFGEEVAAGAPVAASELWRGVGWLSDDREIVFPAEDVGTYVGLGRSYIPKLYGLLTLDKAPATFEQLPLILSGAIDDAGSGVADGAGSGKVFTYTRSATTAGTLQTYTIEAGDNQRVDEVEYAFVQEFTLTGASGGALTLAAKLGGRQATDAEFTGGATTPAVEEILFQSGKLYIDTPPDAVGTTQITAAWLGFSLKWPTGWHPIFSGDGALYFAGINYVGHQQQAITGELVLEHNAQAEAELNYARTETPRLLRMQFTGSALTTAGAYTYKTLTLDLALRYTAVPAVGNQDQDAILTLPFQAISERYAIQDDELVYVADGPVLYGMDSSLETLLWSGPDAFWAQFVVVNE